MAKQQLSVAVYNHYKRLENNLRNSKVAEKVPTGQSVFQRLRGEDEYKHDGVAMSLGSKSMGVLSYR